MIIDLQLTPLDLKINNASIAICLSQNQTLQLPFHGFLESVVYCPIVFIGLTQ